VDACIGTTPGLPQDVLLIMLPQPRLQAQIVGNKCPVVCSSVCADIPCFDEDNSTLVKFVDRHNGWGLTALHLATFKGSSSTGVDAVQAGVQPPYPM
jgi:hypothetical protein